MRKWNKMVHPARRKGKTKRRSPTKRTRFPSFSQKRGQLIPNQRYTTEGGILGTEYVIDKKLKRRYLINQKGKLERIPYR